MSASRHRRRRPVFDATLALAFCLIVLPSVGASCTSREAPDEAAPTPTPADEAPTPSATSQALIDVDDPSTCAPCHGAIVEEWSQSQHAHAHSSRDPFYEAMVELRSEREGADLETRCANCHHPRERVDMDSPVAVAGVSCATCHTVTDVAHGASGGRALTFDPEGRLYGPHEIEGAGSAVHLNGGPADHLRDGETLCLACHGDHQNPQGVDTCNTGTEYAALGGQETCTGCHMPWVDVPSGTVSTRDGHRSHTFIGPHGSRRLGDDTLMRSTAQLSGELAGGGLVIRVANTAGHSAPSGFPGRRLVVEATGFDATGQVVWTAADAEGFAAARVFARAYGDADGAPAMPPYATQLLGDSRLEPGETRVLRTTVPDTVISVEASLRFEFAPGPMLERLGLAADPAFAPMVIAEATIASSAR